MIELDYNRRGQGQPAHTNQNQSVGQDTEPESVKLIPEGQGLTKGQADAVRVKWGLVDVKADQFTEEQVAWGKTVNLNGFGHLPGPPDVQGILNQPDTFTQPEIQSLEGFGGAPSARGILATLLLLKAISPPDPIPPPSAPPAVPSNSSVISAADRLVNTGNTSRGHQSTILTDPVSRKVNQTKKRISKQSALVDPIFGSSLVFGR